MYCSAQTADHGIDIHIPMRDDTLGVNINVYIISHRMMCIDNNSAQTSQMLINEETNKVLPSFMFRVLCKVGNHQRNHFVQTAYRVTSKFFCFFFTFPTIPPRKLILSTFAPSRKTRRKSIIQIN